jgi:hypothetical protein
MFLIGLFVKATVGYLTAALMVAASRDREGE